MAQTCTGIPDAECQVLYNLYNNTGGDQWTDNTSWLSTEPTGSWYGITVDGGHVVGLEIGNNNVTGTILPELGNLVYLQRLALDYNHLTGSIPPELGNLANLERLDLYSNKLSGGLPAFLATPPDTLNLSWNCLYTDNPALLATMETKHSGHFLDTQTIEPENVTAEVTEISGTEENRVRVSWDPISYTSNEGGYKVYYRASW